MPNIIPPIVSSSPPPLDPIDDENDEDENNDDFGDFAVADFALDTDSAGLKTISDTSWTLPNLKHIPAKTELYENGVVSLEVSLENTPPRSYTTILDEEETFQNADNTSHDSVVSAVTDSGNCSASQNSNQNSPTPNVVIDEVKSDASHLYQNGNACNLLKPNLPSVSEGPVCAPIENQDLRDSHKDENLDKRTVDVSSETKVGDFNQQSGAALQDTTFTNSLTDQQSSEVSSLNPEKKTDSGTAEPNVSAENQETADELCPIPKTTVNDNLNEYEFGVWSSNNVTIPNEFCSSSQERLEEENEELSDVQFIEPNEMRPTADFTPSKSSPEEEVPRKLDNFEVMECVRAMIIPEMPCLDYDDDGNDDFGEFSGLTSPGKCSSGVQSVGEPNDDPQFQSPSRRPTLVLSDDVSDLSDFHQPLSTLDETMNTFEQPSNRNSPSSHNSPINVIKAEECPNFEGNFAPIFSFDRSGCEDALDDEFADFTQAEADNKSVASDVWAQAAQASPIQSALAPEDPSDLDDFDDFESAEFQSADVLSKLDSVPGSYFDLNAIQSSLGELLKESFPVDNENCSVLEVDNVGTSSLSGIVLDVEESSIWQGLRDLEATPSLSFQWPGSHSNRGLLGALNIDSRNILFGPKWNTVVPRFAANLGFSPLEPVRAVQNQPPSEPSPRTDIIQPKVVETIKPPSSSEQKFQEVVPAAQFDWSDSGLTNPLDSSTHSSLLDLDLLASFDNLASCSSQTMSAPPAAVVCRRLSTNKDPSTGALATTAASGNPVLTSTPLQVEQLLASSKRSTPSGSLEKKNRDPAMSPEAVCVLDTLPELAFLSARMLMFPVQGERNENKL